MAKIRPREDNIKRNAEGYNDPTAYEAIKKAERKPKPGDIWEVAMNNGRTNTVIVLSVNDNIITCVPMFEHRKTEYEVETLELMYANAAMIGYEYADHFDKFIRVTKDDEFDAVKISVEKILGLSALDGCENCGWDEAEREYVEEQKAEIQRLKEMLEGKEQLIKVFEDDAKEQEDKICALQERCFSLQKENEALVTGVEQGTLISIARAEAERDLYKSLYEQTLERLLQGV